MKLLKEKQNSSINRDVSRQKHRSAAEDMTSSQALKEPGFYPFWLCDLGQVN